MHRTRTLAALRRASLHVRPERLLRVAAIGLALLVSGATLAVAQSGTSQAPRWARTQADAVVRNFPDRNGAELTKLEAGTPVRVLSTSRGTPTFHEVEVAGGVPVWVFGELLQPTAVEGVLRVDASHVNMRPMPESSARSMALRTKLQRGQRVLVLRRKDPSKALREDWVQVWSPDNARVWIEVAQLAPEADVLLAQREFAAATRRIPTRPTVGTREASASTLNTSSGAALRAEKEAERSVVRIPPEATRSLAEADTLYGEVLARPEPSAEDWAGVLGLYRAAHELAPEGTATSEKAFQRMKEVEARREFAAIRTNLREESVVRQQELERLARERAERDLARTVHWGRFQGRGWLESRILGGEKRWFIVWSGETTAEVRCSSARYDLTFFEGFEVGVTGSTIAPATPATATSDALPRVLDVLRIEVLSGSAARTSQPRILR